MQPRGIGPKAPRQQNGRRKISVFRRPQSTRRRRAGQGAVTLLLLAVLYPVAALSQSSSLPTVSLHNDGGGNLVAAEIKRAALLAWGGPVVISGYCNSACTMFTTLPNACLMPRTIIGFHAASVTFRTIGNPQITKYLRNGVRNRWLEEWQFVPNNEIRFIYAEEYVELDPETALCKTGQD